MVKKRITIIIGYLAPGQLFARINAALLSDCPVIFLNNLFAIVFLHFPRRHYIRPISRVSVSTHDTPETTDPDLHVIE